MKSYELLDVLGDVNEDYVRAADADVVRPRSRWKALAACAACAVLVLAAYPVYRAGQPKLHDYTVMEGRMGETLETDLDEMVKAPAGGPAADPDFAPEATMINGADKGGASMYKEPSEEIDGSFYSAPTEDASVQEAALWYDALLKTYRLDEDPEWYGGAWIAGERLLAVAIVDGFRTPELEAEIQEAVGADAVLQFSTVKYSQAFLNSLMEPAVLALEGSDLGVSGWVDVTANCLSMDIYGASIPDDVLGALAALDPEGDAIRVRLFTDKLDALTDEAVKGSAPDVPLATPALTKDDAPHPTPVDGDKVYHGEDIPADAVPGGAYVGELPQAKEEGRSAHYDLLPLDK